MIDLNHLKSRSLDLNSAEYFEHRLHHFLCELICQSLQINCILLLFGTGLADNLYCVFGTKTRSFRGVHDVFRSYDGFFELVIDAVGKWGWLFVLNIFVRKLAGLKRVDWKVEVVRINRKMLGDCTHIV